MKQCKLISVITRTYEGRGEFLKEAVQSVIAQTYAYIELVIVEDGGSSAKDYANGLAAKNLTKVTYLSIPKEGRCRAGNAGLAAASGEYIIFLDDDDQFYPEHLTVLAEILEKNPQASAAYSWADETPTLVKSLNPLHYVEGNKLVRNRQPFSRCLLWHHNYIPIQAALFRREMYDLYGGFDEELDNLEDWNLWTRYSLFQDFVHVDQVTSLYRVPLKKAKMKDRQANLDHYYKLALEKQREMIVQTNPAQVIDSCHEILEYLERTRPKRNVIKKVFDAIGLSQALKAAEKKAKTKIRGNQMVKKIVTVARKKDD